MNRSNPAKQTNYADYREEVRVDFWFSCGYCTLTEAEGAGIGFEIDHYLPTAHYPRLRTVFTNLVYSCETCNRGKADFDPTNGDYPRGLFLYRPDRFPEPTYGLDGHILTAKSELDTFNIEMLRLNRPPLLHIRGLRERLYQAREMIREDLFSHAPPFCD